MIALKLVFQSLAGVGAVVGVAGGGYYAYSLPKDLFLLVSATVATNNTTTLDLFSAIPTEKPSAPANKASSSQASSDSPGTGGTGTGSENGTGNNGAQVPAQNASIMTVTLTEEAPKKEEEKEEETDSKKQYICTTTDSKAKKDKNCEIYSLSFDTTKKSLSSTTILSIVESPNSATKVQKKASLTTDIFFLLKASSSLYESWSFDETKIINLVSTETGNKNFATLKVHAKFEEKTTKGSTNFAIAKVTKIPEIIASATAETTYNCSLKSKNGTNIKPCFFTKLSSSPFEDQDFTSITIPATNTAITFAINDHYLIKWNDDNKHNIEDLKTETVVIEQVGANTQAAKKTELEITAPVFLKTATAGTVEKIIFVK